MKRTMEEETIDYNSIPVYFCEHCMSLAVIDGGFIDYCDVCGSTDIGKASLEEYDALHEQRFGTKVFYKDQKNGREY